MRGFHTAHFLIVLLSLLSSLVGSVFGQQNPDFSQMPLSLVRSTPSSSRTGNPYRNGAYPLVLGAIGGGVGSALGSLDGPIRASMLGSVGGTLGGFMGSLVEEGDSMHYIVIGSVTGGYIGGLVGGFAGGASGQVAESLSTVAAACVLGVAASVAGHEAFGTPGLVGGAIGGVIVGGGIGKLIVGPAATIVLGGVMGGVGAGVGSYLGSTDMIGRPR